MVPYTLSDEYAALVLARARTRERVEQPLVLVEGAERVAELQGHPECHVLPYPLEPHSPLGKEFSWQALDRRLGFDRTRAGFGTVLTDLQRRMYERELAGRGKTRARAALNAYFTAFFNAWLDNQNLYGLMPKRWLVAASESEPSWLRKHYPDGLFVGAGTNLGEA